jgi:hypothetical protein
MREDVFLITKSVSVKEIQEYFSGLFPFLRINFFKSRNGGSLWSGHRATLFSPESLLKDIYPGIIDGELIFRESMSVYELENEFNTKFNLSVQILRRSGNLWLDTSRTNSWTLKEQNDLGREISPEQKSNRRITGENDFRRNLG